MHPDARIVKPISPFFWLLHESREDEGSNLDELPAEVFDPLTALLTL